MRKGLTTLLVILLAVGAMLVSCKAEVGTPADELVSVSFEEVASRSITATLETFNKDNYYWKYAAKKADDSGLTSGATATYDEAGALPVKDGAKGLGSTSGETYKAYKVAGFSQGLWNFKLWAYRDSNYSDLLFYGEAKNVSLSRGGDNTASVVVNPVSEGDGYIKLATGEDAIKFIPKKGTDKADQLMFTEVTNPDGSAVSGISYDDVEKRYVLPAGIYKVTVKFANASQTIIYGEGYVIATVYSGLTTTIGGDLNELITYAQFDADLNPDAVNVQAESAAVTLVLTETPVKIESKEGAEKQVVANVARSDANAIITEMAAAQAVDTGADTKLKLTLNVDPTAATEQSVTYEIGMKATLTYTKASETQTTEKPVTSLTNYVIVEIEMSSDLSSVTVKHSGTPMYPCTTKGQLDTITTEQEGYSGFYFYDPAGTLYIKTRTFSPFEIKYEAPKNYVAEVDGVKYGTLAEAVAQVKDAGTSTVKLLADVALTSTIETTKTFALNLNGFNITAANCRAIWVKSGELTLTGKGTIAANKVDSTSDFKASSSVIRVGVSEAAARAELTIGADVTVSSDYCYGVTVFGKNSPYNILTVNGKIKVTGTASAISGNGSPDLETSGIYINAGAEIYAENDYAIFHPGAGTLTINGGKITGKGGIEAKGGEVFIYSGEIMATAPETSHVVNQNGPSTSGYAIVAVENSGYKGPATIQVNGAVVKGPIATVKDSEAKFDASLSIRGGSYTLNPWKYVADGYEANYDSASKLWVVTYFDGSHPGAVAKVVYPSSYTVYYDSLQTAINEVEEGCRVELLRNVEFPTSTDRLFIDKSIVFEGNGKTVTAHGRGFAPRAAVTTFRNVIINNKDNGARCIDVRESNLKDSKTDKYVVTEELNLENVILSTQGASDGYTQPLTIGGNQSTPLRVNITDSVIKTNDDATAYYAIITFNPVNLTIEDSEVHGWADMYFKGVNSSAGSSGSVVTAKNTKFVSNNVYGGPTNAFGSFVFEDSNIVLTFEDCEFVVDSIKDQYQYVFLPKNSTSGFSVFLDSECSFDLEGNLTEPYKYRSGSITFKSDVDLGATGRIFENDDHLHFVLEDGVYSATVE